MTHCRPPRGDILQYVACDSVAELRVCKCDGFVELHESKFPVAYELTMAEFRELMDARVAGWCGRL